MERAPNLLWGRHKINTNAPPPTKKKKHAQKAQASINVDSIEEEGIQKVSEARNLG